jgi:transcriptional regulator with XRE-family HTH domain
MGGKGSGRRGDPQRRRQAARLRAEGWSLPQIARALGITKQAVHLLLHPRGEPAAQANLCCQDCGKPICPMRPGMRSTRRSVCLDCLARRPVVDFGQRLVALRLARGLTGRELAQALGVPPGTVSTRESSRDGTLRRPNLLRLEAFFGPEFLPAR